MTTEVVGSGRARSASRRSKARGAVEGVLEDVERLQLLLLDAPGADEAQSRVARARAELQQVWELLGRR